MCSAYLCPESLPVSRSHHSRCGCPSLCVPLRDQIPGYLTSLTAAVRSAILEMAKNPVRVCLSFSACRRPCCCRVALPLRAHRCCVGVAASCSWPHALLNLFVAPCKHTGLCAAVDAAQRQDGRERAHRLRAAAAQREPFSFVPLTTLLAFAVSCPPRRVAHRALSHRSRVLLAEATRAQAHGPPVLRGPDQRVPKDARGTQGTVVIGLMV